MSDGGGVEGERFQRLKQYWKQDPKNRLLAIDAAQSALNAGMASEAAEFLQEAVSQLREDGEIIFLLGTALLASARFTEAVVQFEALPDELQAHPAVRYNMAYAYTELREFQFALDVIRQIPDQGLQEIPESYGLLGRIHHHLGHLDDAVRNYRRHAGAFPGSASAWGDLALAAFDNTDSTTARVSAEQAVRLDANSIGGNLALGSLALEERSASDAIGYFSAVSQQHVQVGRAWSGLGFAHMLVLDWNAARSNFEKAVLYMPDHIGTWHGLAWVQILLSDVNAAEVSLHRAMEIDRNFGETHGGLAVIAALKGDEKQAEQLARRGIGLDPQSFSSRYARVLLKQRRGATEKAKNALDVLIDAGVPGGREGLQNFVAELVGRSAGISAHSSTRKH